VDIQGVTPNSAQADTFVVLNIVGSGFQNGAVVTFEGGAGGAQEITSSQVVSPSLITINMTARNDGSAGTQVWDIRVINPDASSAVLTDAFTVYPIP
jgi:hypothetical protein